MNAIIETSRGISLVPIWDTLLKNREIFLVDEVNAESTNSLIMQLKYLESMDEESPITLYINSPGGDVVSGLALFDYIKLMRVPVNTVCIGTAASMGAILFLAGKKREMYPHTRLMIHDPAYGSGTMVGKKSHELRHQLDKLDETREALASIIADATGKTLEEIYEVTADDTFFSATEAIDFGLATGIVKKTRKRGR